MLVRVTSPNGIAMSDASTESLATDDRSPLTNLSETLSTRLFTTTELLLVPAGFVLGIATLNVAFKLVDAAVFDGALLVDATWPISAFYFHSVWAPIPLYLLTILTATLLFAAVTWSVHATDATTVYPVVAGGTLLVLATTLIQGVGPGFVGPIAGSAVADYGAPGIQDGIQYYHEAIQITDPVAFVTNYATAQPDMVLHATTHPPGAVLTVYLLHELLGAPALITVAIAVLAVTITGYSLYHLLTAYVDDRTAQYTTFLYLLIPSIQIYYAASLDALIAAFLLAGVYFYTQHDTAWGRLAAVTCLFIASFQTFLFLFVLPILLASELHTHRTISRTTVVVTALAAIYTGLYLALDFNYLASFVVATSGVHSQGVPLLAAPGSYLVTRLENIAEILLFFTPFLTWLLLRERQYLTPRTQTGVLSITAIGTLLLMFLVGVYQTGETARGAMFIYPFLILPLATYFDDLDLQPREQTVLAVLVFAQTIAMQAAGFYFW